MGYPIKYEDIPFEVWEVWVIQTVGQPVGFNTWDHCNEIIKRHPEYFPWEHKYASIPQSVHNAYYREAYSYEMMPRLTSTKEYAGIIPSLLLEPECAIQGGKSIQELLANMFKAEVEEKKRKETVRLERKKLWDKYYSKYGLEYRD